MKNTLGDRIKRYENVSNNFLVNKMPVFIRIDGKSFHSFTKGMEKPFDKKLRDAMMYAGRWTASGMMNFKLGYHQSDEFTFMLLDTDKLTSETWFNNEINKIVSVSASIFTSRFNEFIGGTIATFDSRAFNVPMEDAPNVFIWRQRDWERNSVQMYCRSMYSHKELVGKNLQQMHDLIHAKGGNWNDLDDKWKNGSFLSEYDTTSKKMSYEEIYNLIN